MRTVTYKSVVSKIALLSNAGASSTIGAPSSQQFDAINILIAARLEEYVHRYWWPCYMRTDFRTYAPVWASTGSYVPADQVYYYATKKYYICTKATSSVAPANSAGTTLTTNWFEAFPSYPSATSWSSTLAYTSGQLVLYLNDGNYYACHTASSAGTLPTDTTKWGQVLRFAKKISLIDSAFTEIDDIEQIYEDDPDANPSAPKVQGWVVNDNIITVDSCYPTAWVRYRIRTPDFSGSNWSATTAYAVDDKVYHDSTGNYYVASQAGTNHIPSAASAYWDLVPFPHDLARVVIQGCYADMVRRTEQGDRYTQEIAEAERMLSLEIDRYDRQQQQKTNQNVLTR